MHERNDSVISDRYYRVIQQENIPVIDLLQAHNEPSDSLNTDDLVQITTVHIGFIVWKDQRLSNCIHETQQSADEYEGNDECQKLDLQTEKTCLCHAI